MNNILSVGIERVDNGWMLSYVDDEGEKKISVYRDAVPIRDPAAFAALLYDLVEFFGMVGTRYDNKRIYIKVAPGDKYEDAQ